MLLIPLIVLVCSLSSCNINQESTNKSELKVIPKPMDLKLSPGIFKLNEKTEIYFYKTCFESDETGDFIKNELQKVIGLNLPITTSLPKTNSIIFEPVEKLGQEEYILNVTENYVKIKANSESGFFYGLQSLLQLFEINNLSNKEGVFQISAVSITDKPAFEWRGYMLDESRHFFGKKHVLKVLDFMASLKLNRFHWHLADDQGWRLEIKQYPKLTSIGAWRVDHNVSDEDISNWWGRPVQKDQEEATYGGFYTQDEIKEIVAYAKQRHIEILPEIDVPGHSREILASYPELSCDGAHYKVATGGIASENALCASNELTYKFLDRVLAEVSDLFPFEYIHIGGDECNKNGWKNHDACQELIKQKGLKDEHELQSYFIKRVEKIVNAKGKHLIGWDEILEGGLAPNATVMSWRGESGGVAAAKAGHNVIMTPNFANYLDLKQGQSDFEPNLGYSEALLSTCYNYSIVPEELSTEEAKHILGTQGNLWTESISDWGKLTYMTFPRLYAIAENAWTKNENKNFDDFISRLKPHLEDLNTKGVRYAKSVFNPWIYQKGKDNSIEISFDSELSTSSIRYTLDGSDPTESSFLFTKPFTIDSTVKIKAGIFDKNQLLGNIIEVNYPIHKAAGAKVIYHSDYSKRDSAGGDLALTDLNYGQLDVNNDRNWQGFEDGMDVELELMDEMEINKVSLTFLRKTIHGVYPPKNIILMGSKDGKDYKVVGQSGLLEKSYIQGRNKITTDIECNVQGLKNIRIIAEPVNPIPKGHHQAGKKGYLKLDEIILF